MNCRPGGICLAQAWHKLGVQLIEFRDVLSASAQVLSGSASTLSLPGHTRRTASLEQVIYIGTARTAAAGLVQIQPSFEFQSHETYVYSTHLDSPQFLFAAPTYPHCHHHQQQLQLQPRLPDPPPALPPAAPSRITIQRTIL